MSSFPQRTNDIFCPSDKWRIDCKYHIHNNDVNLHHCFQYILMLVQQFVIPKIEPHKLRKIMVYFLIYLIPKLEIIIIHVPLDCMIMPLCYLLRYHRIIHNPLLKLLFIIFQYNHVSLLIWHKRTAFNPSSFQ
jgi:hypothetical protein